MIEWLRASSGDPEIALESGTLSLAIRRHPRAKRMTLRLAPDGSEARVTIPRWARTAEAIEFAQARAEWLERQLQRVPRASPPRPGGSVTYRGRDLAIDWRRDAPRKPALHPDRIEIGGPAEGLPRRLQRWLEAQALALFESDLAYYCERAGLEPPQIRLSRAQRRWGSCSSGGIVRVNWRLVQAPDRVRRSVVAHEVAHLRHFDHSPEFKALLGALFESDLAAADRWLKENGRTLYSTFG